ncbi:hypothetical protein K4F52_004739 [Lecanicillium sp. MT-2017a]|nr:hypothetical protein K4F52_004739 [Lecanicillium sp. MT-2017a]
MAADTKASHFLSGKKILVAGAGMGGLSFALSLHKNWDASIPAPEVRIVDQDTRDQGINRETYSMSLAGTDKDGALLVCRDLGLLEKVTSQAVEGVDPRLPFHIWDKNFKSLISMRHKPVDDLPTPAVRIRRPALKTTLIEAAEAQYPISWSTSAGKVEKLPDGRLSVTLVGPDGTETAECDFLVAADGSNSKIRQHFRPSDELEYTGAVQLGGVAEFADGECPEPLKENMGLLITGDGVGSFFSHIGPGRMVWGLSKWERDAPRDGYDKTDPKAFADLLDECREMAKGIAEPMATVIDKTTDPAFSVVLPARDKQPFGHQDGDLPPNIVFIGDANHTVSAFAGNGGNLAIKDGWDLATELCKASSATDAVAAYDKLALPRANKSLKDSRDRMGQCHTSGWKWTMLKTAISAGSLFMGSAK